MPREQWRLAAIVSADVAGYSRLMGRDESGTLAALKALRREIVDPNIEAHRGRIVKSTGDGLLLEFASVVDAVRCVDGVQAAMAAHNADVPEDRRIEFRIGVNIGDIIIDGDDTFGDGGTWRRARSWQRRVASACRSSPGDARGSSTSSSTMQANTAQEYRLAGTGLQDPPDGAAQVSATRRCPTSRRLSRCFRT
jgi:hypothetical protein